MDNNLVTFEAFPLPSLLSAPAPEQRRALRKPEEMQARLAYGGLTPGLVGCTIVDMSETGVRIETYIGLEDLPEIFTLDICGVYNRARKCWVKDGQMGLAFIFEDSDPFDRL